MASSDDIAASVAQVSAGMRNTYLQTQYGKLARKKAQVGNRQVPSPEGNYLQNAPADYLRDETPQERLHNRSNRITTVLSK